MISFDINYTHKCSQTDGLSIVRHLGQMSGHFETTYYTYNKYTHHWCYTRILSDQSQQDLSENWTSYFNMFFIWLSPSRFVLGFLISGTCLRTSRVCGWDTKTILATCENILLWTRKLMETLLLKHTNASQKNFI